MYHCNLLYLWNQNIELIYYSLLNNLFNYYNLLRLFHIVWRISPYLITEVEALFVTLDSHGSIETRHQTCCRL